MTTKGVILEQAEPSTTHIEPDGAGSNSPVMPETEAEKTAWQKSSPWVHGLLGVANFVPGLSIVTGALDAAIYTAEAEFVEAGIAAASMIPGGKVVTTVTKVAKGAVTIAKGTGAAAKIAHGAHEADAVAKAAKVARETKGAKEAREAKEAADKAQEAASGAQNPKNGVTIKAHQHKVPCFHPFDKKKFMRMSKEGQKSYLKDMAAQLKRQENAINSLTATEYKTARDAFGALNRNPAANAAQEAFRERALRRITASINESLRKAGMGVRESRAEAAVRAKIMMDKLAAQHDPDMVAGGWMRPNPTGMGRADVNSSIGGSWNQNDRISGMDREAQRAIDSGNGDQKMNVKLEPCRGKGMR